MGGTLPGLDDCGTHLEENGVRFCVWAPFADAVSVTGDFTNWSDNGFPLNKGNDGCWYAEVEHAEVGQEYKYLVRHGDKVLWRNDPHALQLTASNDSSVIVDPSFEWDHDEYKLPPREELVLYELHVGTFVRNDPAMPGTFHDAMMKLDYLVELGINAIEIMPCSAAWMDRWWGYTPDNIYAVDAAYGGRRAFMEFVKAAHEHGIGVILDVVYNHLNKDAGLDLWQFDGWSEREDTGGIYFYNDGRAHTPWGDTRPDYGRPEVRRYIVQNAEMWLRDFHIDGLRLDSVIHLRNVEGKNNDPAHDLADGWRLLQEVNDAAQRSKPGALMIAEDLQGNDWITKPTKDGGAGFRSQWDSTFSGILREELAQKPDNQRDVGKIAMTIGTRTNGNPFERVIFLESHDTDAAATGGKRFEEAIAPGRANTMSARKRATLAAALLCTSPGTPMIFQGQEFADDNAFSHYESLDWQEASANERMLTLYKHLFALRRNVYKNTAGLLGLNVDVFHVDNATKIVAYRRWDKGGPADDVVVTANFSDKQQTCQLALPAKGIWWTRLNTDWKGYGDGFGDSKLQSIEAVERDGSYVSEVMLPAYTVFVLSQDS